jgi:hypothetical protein
MLQRGYDKRYKEKNPTYINCSVSSFWHNFQNFARWYEENWKPWMDTTWHLDKDILFKGNKIYSPETCCLVPREINLLFVKCDKSRGNLPIGICNSENKKKFLVSLNKGGKQVHIGTFDTIEEAFQAYKTAKEEYIKEMADVWKPLITKQVYQALINYKVEITD